MPYDARPVSEGGNRGIDEQFTRAAPKGQFRVVGVDTFDGEDWVEGDFASLDLAIEAADRSVEGKQMLVMHVYNDKGKHRHQAGKF